MAMVDTIQAENGYQKFTNRNSVPTAVDAVTSLNGTKEEKAITKGALNEDGKKVKLFLLITVILLLTAIAFFAATAILGAKTIFEKEENTSNWTSGDEKKSNTVGVSSSSKSVNNNYKTPFLSENNEDSTYSNISNGSTPASLTAFFYNAATEATPQVANTWHNTTYATNRLIRINNSPGWLEASNNILSSIDFDADPCQDFYQYACGVWPLKNPLRPDESTRTIYTSVSRRVSDDIRKAINQLDENTNLSLLPDILRAVKFTYEACVNNSRVSNEGPLALLTLLNNTNNGIGKWPLISTIIDSDQNLVDDKIDNNWLLDNLKIDTNQERYRSIDFAATIGRLKLKYGIDTVFFTYVGSDETNSTINALQLGGFMLPLGLGIFKAPLYLNDSRYGKQMIAYADLINTTANLLLRDAGYVNPFVNYSRVQDIVNFERQLAAHVSKSNSNFRKKWTLKKLIKEIPTFDWRLFFENLLPKKLHNLLQNDDTLVLDVASKKFLANVAFLVTSTDPVIVQNYLIWRLVKYSLPYLSQEYRDALQKLNFVLTGTQKSSTQEEQCTDYVQGSYNMPGLGYATGRIFVDHAFTEKAKKDVEKMVEGIVDAFQVLINKSEWMDNETKSTALEKAQTMITNVAYPDWITDNDQLDNYYSNLTITSSDTMFEINWKLRGWAVMKNQMQLLTSIDPNDFGGPPSATNAWYNVGHNALTVPAGELQPPFYKSIYPAAINYGAAGSVIGHEIMHGFDSQGSRFDASGQLRRWWSPESMKEFQRRTDCLEKQYDRFCYSEFDPKLCVDGLHTVGENTADLGGLKAAFLAYKNSEKNSLETTASLPGPATYYSHEQLFFLSFASFWCGSATKEALRDQLITNQHTPAKYRVIGTLRNLPEFAHAFQCAKDSFMNPEEKCEIW